MYTLHYFDNAQDARDYRRDHGTGGWIFEPETINHALGDCVILFPPHMPPAMIFHHHAARGPGRLIGSA